MKKQADILTQYAEIDEAHVDALLQEELRRNRKKLVVLDDDPTGVQTVHDVSTGRRRTWRRAFKRKRICSTC